MDRRSKPRRRQGASKKDDSPRHAQSSIPGKRADASAVPVHHRQSAYDRALEALSRMRAEDRSLRQAARAAGTTPRTVLKRVGQAVYKGQDGRYRARRSDRLLRTLKFPTEDGITSVRVRGSELASRIAQYWAALDRYVRGDSNALREFEERWFHAERVKYEFLTNRWDILRLARAGELQFEELYSPTV